jgi:hypothetical protein
MKSEYDTTKDVVVEDFGTIEGTDFSVCTRSYDGGAPKLAVIQTLGKNKDKIRPIFRLPPGDALTIAKFIVEHVGVVAEPIVVE